MSTNPVNYKDKNSNDILTLKTWSLSDKPYAEGGATERPEETVAINAGNPSTWGLNMNSREIADLITRNYLEKNQTLRVLDELTAPPGSESRWDRYIVGASATGDWNTHDGKIATYNGLKWHFITPNKWDIVYDIDEGAEKIYDGTGWLVRCVTSTSLSLIPTGGTLSLGNGYMTQELIRGYLLIDVFIEYTISTGTITAVEVNNLIALSNFTPFLTDQKVPPVVFNNGTPLYGAPAIFQSSNKRLGLGNNSGGTSGDEIIVQGSAKIKLT